MKNLGAIRLLLFANFISGIAQGISMISIPLYFAQSSQSNWFNNAYVLITVVSLFWSLYGGTLIDKYNRKKIFLCLNLVNGLAIGSIAYLESTTTGYTNYMAAMVFAMTFWNYNLHYPCFYAFMQEITEKEHYDKIASYIEVQSQMASALAGAAAAFLISGGFANQYFDLTVEPWTLSQIFALDALTYFAALAIIFLMRFKPLSHRAAEGGTVLYRLRLGFNYLKEHPYTFLFGIATQSVFIVVLLHVFNLAPIYVSQHLKASSEVFAVSEVFYASGAVLAGLAVHKIFNKMPFLQVIILLIFISVFEYCCLILSYSILIFYLMTFLLGFTNAGIRVVRVSHLFKIIPNQIMGRANSIFFLTNAFSRIIFLSIFSLPFFHQDGQVIYSFMILTVFMLLTALILLFFFSRIIQENNS